MDLLYYLYSVTYMYADDLVILAENAEDLHKLLNVVHPKWKMQLNKDTIVIVIYLYSA